MNGITYDILQTQYVEGIEHLKVLFKAKSSKLDADTDYGAEYLGHPLWNGSVFFCQDTSEVYNWSLEDKKWYKVGA